jgi:hypothetical protein
VYSLSLEWPSLRSRYEVGTPARMMQLFSEVAVGVEMNITTGVITARLISFRWF